MDGIERKVESGSESGYLLWRPMFPEEMLSYLSRTMVAQYAARRLRQGVTNGSNMEGLLNEAQAIAVARGKVRDFLKMVDKPLAEFRGVQQDIIAFCHGTILQTGKELETFGVTYEVTELKPNVARFVLDSPICKEAIKAKATFDGFTETEFKSGHPRVIKSLCDGLFEMLDGADKNRGVVAMHVLERLGPVGFQNLYKPYNL